MKTLSLFWKITTLRESPEQLRVSKEIFLLALLANFFVSVSLNLMHEALFSSTMLSLLECFTVATLTAAILIYVNKIERLWKTLAALMGAGAIIGLFAYLMLTFVPISQMLIFRLTILLWNLSAIAKILSHTLEIRFNQAFFITIGYAFCLWQILSFFYPIITAQ